MDQRLIVTVPFVAHLLCGVMYGIAYSMSEAAFVGNQLEFLVVAGYVTPLVAMGLVWLRNYARGAPLLVGSAGMACWFAVYFFYLHDNPASVTAVGGDLARSYLAATVGVVSGFVCCMGSGTWLWYRESEGFRSAVDGLVRPPDSSR